MKTRFLRHLMPCVFCFPMTALAQEPALVWSSSAYTVDGRGKIVHRLTFLDSLEVQRHSKDTYTVPSKSANSETIHETHILKLSDLEYLNNRNTQRFLSAMKEIRRANKLSKEGDYSLSVSIHQEVLSSLEEMFDRLPPAYAWIMASMAYDQYFAGETEAAFRQLDGADQLLRQRDAEQHFHAAEVRSIRGLLLLEEDQPKEAIPLFREAVRIASVHRGKRSADVAAYQLNLSLALEQVGKRKKTISARQTALAIENKTYPEAAIEIAEHEAYLAYLLLENEQYDESLEGNLRALGLYNRYHPEEQLEFTRVQFNIAYTYYVQEKFERAARLYNALYFEPENDTSDEDRAELKSLKKQALNNQGLVEYELDHQEEAAEYFRLASKLYDAENPESLDADILFNLAGRYQDLGRNRDATEWYQRAAKLYRQIDGADSANVASVAEALESMNSPVDTLAALEKEREERIEKISEKKSNKTADYATDQPVQRANQGTRPSGASPAVRPVISYLMHIKPHEKMLVAKRTTSIMDGSRVLRTVQAGTRLWSLEERDSWHRVVIPSTKRTAWVADADVENILKSKIVEMTQDVNRRSAGNPQATRIVQELNKKIPIAMNMTAERGLVESQALTEEVVDLFEQVASKDNFIAATMRSRLANIYFMNGQYVKSRQLIERSLPLQRAALGVDHPFVAWDLARLAILLVTVGDSLGAQACLEEAIEISLARFGESDPRLTGLKIQMANLLLESGQLSDAKPLFRQLVSKGTSAQEGAKLFQAIGHFGEGRIANSERRFEDAIESFNASFRSYAELGDAFDAAKAKVLFFLSKTHVLAGDGNAARKALEDAERLVASGNGLSPGTETELKTFRTLIEARDGNFREALALVDDVMASATDAYGDTEAPQLRAGYAMRGRILAQLDRHEAAARDFEHARRIAHSHIVETLADQTVDKQIQFLRANDADHLHAALSLATVSNTPRILEQSATWLLNSKNIASELAARDLQIRKVLRTETGVANYDTWLDARKRIAVLPRLTPEEKEDQELDKTEANLKSTEASAFARLPAEAKRLIRKSRSNWILADEIRAKLKPNEVFIDILRMRRELGRSSDGTEFEIFAGVESYIAWIIPATGSGDVAVVDLGIAEEMDAQVIKPYMDEMGKSLVRRKLVGEEAATAEAQALSQKLTDAIWKPIAEKIAANVSNLTLCPDSQLWKVPWAALTIDTDRFLVEDFNIRFVSSGRDLLSEKVRLAGLSRPVIFADPAYGASADEIESPSDAPNLRSFARRKGRRFNTQMLRNALPRTIKRLAGTANEAISIQPYLADYSGMQSKLLLQTKASEAAFRAIDRPHTLFIGTHGFFFPETDALQADALSGVGPTTATDSPENALDSPLRRCGLLLAGCVDESAIDATTGIDGILTGEEVVAQDLRGTELVVLSACETGVGDLNDGQGVAGLRQAIQLAGAKSVVSTLWSIDDQATTALVEDFFQYLADGKTKSQALRAAQLARIETRRSRFGAAHPFYWAAFTVTGQD